MIVKVTYLSTALVQQHGRIPIELNGIVLLEPIDAVEVRANDDC